MRSLQLSGRPRSRYTMLDEQQNRPSSLFSTPEEEEQLRHQRQKEHLMRVQAINDRRRIELQQRLEFQRQQNAQDHAANMLAAQSRYGQQAAAQKFGFDSSLQGDRLAADASQQQTALKAGRREQERDLANRLKLSEMDTERQFGYLDRQSKYGMDRAQQDFDLNQKAAMEEIAQRKEDQFDTALHELRQRYQNLNPEGQKLLKQIESTLADVEASEEQNDRAYVRYHKEKLMGTLSRAMSPQMLQSQVENITDDYQIWRDPVTKQAVPIPRKPIVVPFDTQVSQFGGFVTGTDGNPKLTVQAQRPSTTRQPEDDTLKRSETLNSIATEIMTASNAGKDSSLGDSLMTYEQAYQQAIQLHPELMSDARKAELLQQQRENMVYNDVWLQGASGSGGPSPAQQRAFQQSRQQGSGVTGGQARRGILPPGQPRQAAPQPKPIDEKQIQRLSDAGYGASELEQAKRILSTAMKQYPNAKTIDDFPASMRTLISNAQQVMDIALGR